LQLRAKCVIKLYTPRPMKRIEKIYRIAELLFTDPILQWSESKFGGKCSFYECMFIADRIISIADGPAPETSESSMSTDLVDEIQRPFEILEREIKLMRLDESGEWENE